MDRSLVIGRLGTQLDAAVSGADWDGLERAVRDLARQLQALAVKGPWSAAERVALQRLRAAHERAAQALPACRRAWTRCATTRKAG
jgi:hypothetical protein